MSAPHKSFKTLCLTTWRISRQATSFFLPNSSLASSTPCFALEQYNARLYEIYCSQSLSGMTLNWHPNRQGYRSYTVFIDATNFDEDCIKLVAQFRQPGEELKLTTVSAAIDSYGKQFVPQVLILDDFPMQLAIVEYGGESFANQSLAYNSQHR
jgi:hypothetical protein